MAPVSLGMTTDNDGNDDDVSDLLTKQFLLHAFLLWKSKTKTTKHFHTHYIHAVSINKHKNTFHTTGHLKNHPQSIHIHSKKTQT